MHIAGVMSRASQGISEKTGDGRKIHFPTEKGIYDITVVWMKCF
jgi:hypothetical protein